MLIYFLLFFGLLGSVSLYRSDFVKSYLDPAGYYQSKLDGAAERKSYFEEELSHCLQQLGILVKGKKYHIQQYMVDGLSAAEAVDSWKEEVHLTQRLCDSYRNEIDDLKTDMQNYKNKLQHVDDK